MVRPLLLIEVFWLLNAVCFGNVAQLQQSFAQPPDDARIMVRWWWFGPSVTNSEIEREMQLMKQGGIGGFEIQPTYPLALDGAPPGLKNLKFMSPEFLSALQFTSARARQLGLRMDLTLGSGWPFGGPEFSAQEAATSIHLENLSFPAGQRRVPLPRLRESEHLVAAFVKTARGYIEAPAADGTLQLPAEATDAAQVQLFVSRGGIMAVKRPAYGADGFVIDHYDPASIAKFIRNVAEPEIRACRPNFPYAVFCDSLEVTGENWTPGFLAEFKKRRGYDLRPLLPALFSDTDPKALDIRHDWGRTLTELFNEHFNGAFTKLAAAYHTRFRIQGYGTPPAALYSYAFVDLPEGEGYQWKGLSTSRWAASACHLLDRPVVSSETFTWLHSPVFRATPLDMKSEADMHFLSGINQIICHGWPYTAEGVGFPGWSFYAAAVFNEKNPWWIVMPDVSRYLQRVSHILRQGTPVNDVALFLPNSDAWASFGRSFSMNTALETRMTGIIPAILDSGYNFDFFDDQLLESRGRVEGNELVFGDVRYRIVILPGVERIPPATMRKLAQFARSGGILVATRRLPQLAPGYKATEQETRFVRETARQLFQGNNAPCMYIENEDQLGRALARRLKPDVELSPPVPEIGVVHRHTDDAEVYFVANTANQPRSVRATFRLHGLYPELWDAMSGRVAAAHVEERTATTTMLRVNLEAYGSTIVVFSARTLPASEMSTTPVPAALDLSEGWTVRFGTGGEPVTLKSLSSWTDSDATRHFSGVATYEKTITVAPEMVAPGLTLSIDFGKATPSQTGGIGTEGRGYKTALDVPVRDAALVYVNGRRAGSVWAPPYTVDVSGLLRAGENQIRIEVANLATNRMAAMRLPNYDYDGVTKRFGSRFQPQDLDLIQVLPAGLLGPIRIVAARAGEP